MPDWKKIVREKLGRLPLSNGRREEVIEELAQQLESAYEEALAQGITEQEALRRSLAQFKDWEKLRSEVFHSVEGARLPVWEQSSFFAPRRLPVWIALALTLLLLAAPSFRQALAILPVPGESDPWALTARVFSEKALRRIEQSGDKQKYARALAFVALHSPKEDDLRAMHAAEKAIALDPQLTWISAHVSHATYLIPGYDPRPWIERLKAWDPQNSFPYLLEASASIHSDWESHWAKYNAATPALRQALAAEPSWRIPMEKAFAAARVDFYGEKQFELDRQVLQEQGFDRPDILLVATWSHPLPDFLAMRNYAETQLNEVAEKAEKEGRIGDALAACQSVIHFAEKVRVEGSTDIQNHIAVRLQQEAYEKMIPLLRREGRAGEAAAVETTIAALSAASPSNKRPYYFGVPAASEAVAARSAHTAAFFGLIVMFLGMATAMWIIFVITLKWKPDLNRALNRLTSMLCFAPPVLLLSCSALLLSYYPYARPIGQYASGRELHEAFAPFFRNFYQFPNFDNFADIWLNRMFWPSVWCAGVALAGAILLSWVARRQRPDRPGAA
jgi:hypothetical protein